MKRKLKHITVSGLIIFAICLVIFLRASGKKAKADQREESSLRPVAVALVTRTPIGEYADPFWRLPPLSGSGRAREGGGLYPPDLR